MNKKMIKIITAGVLGLMGFICSISVSSNPGFQSGITQISEVSGYKEWTKINPDLQIVLNPISFANSISV